MDYISDRRALVAPNTYVAPNGLPGRISDWRNRQVTPCEPRKEQLWPNFPIINRHNHHHICLFHESQENPHWSFRMDRTGLIEEDSAYTGEGGEDESYIDEVCSKVKLLPILSY